MYLDKRSKGILEDLISRPNLSSKQLELLTGLSRRQIKYSVEKINDWLSENNYPKIKRLNNGKFVIDPTLTEIYANDRLKITENYILSEDERVLLILFILLSQYDLSLVHFAQALQVSKATILSDMKQAQYKLEKFRLAIVYSRIEGYQLNGDEWDQRNLLFYVLQELSVRYGGLALVQDFTMLEEKTINHFFTQLEKIEEFLGIKFTDEKIQILPYCIGIILDRVKRGKIIRFDYQIQYKELSDTREYEMTEHLIKNEVNLPEVERLYITLQLLSTNIFSSDVLSENEIPQLRQALLDSLTLFEMNAFITLKEKEQLVNKLMLHLKPAYYRIKYNLTIAYGTAFQLDEAYYELDHLVEKSLSPLEKFINNKIPPKERMYLTLFIGGHLIETKQVLSERKKAIVVCRNGVTVSKLLKSTLTKLFPEFEFYPTMSLREFYEKKPHDVDVVFSPESIQINENLFIVQAQFSELEQWRLRQRVMKRLYGFNFESIDVNRLIMLIEESATIHNKPKLLDDLLDYFFSSKNELFIQEGNKHNPDLYQLLNEETIQIVEHVNSWRDAIRLAAKPLLTNHFISLEYVDKMIESHDFDNPYMVLGESMAIPHASPEYGVNRLSIGLLIIKNGVLFSDDLKINFVVVIAPTDTKQHVKAIYQLSNIANNKEVLMKLLQAEEKTTVIKTLEQYITNKVNKGKEGL